MSLEKDPKFLPVLKALRKEHQNFRYEIGDALEVDYVKILRERIGNSEQAIDSHPALGYKVVANIPYYITGKILQMLMTAKHKPTTIVVLTQKEVAQNLTAAAGDLSILAISVQLYGQPELVQTVLARSFYPAPKVDSAVVRVRLFDKPRYTLADEKRFFKILKACFSGKRKQIHNTLVNNLHLTKEQTEKILQDIGVSPQARPQELTIEQWIKLAEKI